MLRHHKHMKMQYLIIKTWMIPEVPIDGLKKLSHMIRIIARESPGHNVSMHCDCLNVTPRQSKLLK